MKEFFLIHIFLQILFCQQLFSECPCTYKNLHPLTEQEKKILIKAYPLWNIETKNNIQQLHKSIYFNDKNFFFLLAPLAYIAETIEHHPDLTITGSKLSIHLFTHSQKTITKKDAYFLKLFEAYDLNYDKITKASTDLLNMAFSANKNKKILSLFDEQSTLYRLKNTHSNFALLAFKLYQCFQKALFNEAFYSKISLNYGSCTLEFQKNEDTQTKEMIDLCKRTFEQ